MITPELISYVKEQISRGQTLEAVKTTLLNQGWNEADISLAFSQSALNQPTPLQPPLNANVTTQPKTEKPKNIFDFKNLKWYEWLALLPAFFLLINGGALGGGIGVLGWSVSLKVIRNESRSKILKILLVIGLTIGYYATYFIAGSFLRGFIEGLLGK